MIHVTIYIHPVYAARVLQASSVIYVHVCTPLTTHALLDLLGLWGLN